MFGDDWFVRGCISSHYQNMVVEGEEVQAMVEKTPTDGVVRIAAQKRDGTPVLMGTASLGPDYGETELEQRMAATAASGSAGDLSGPAGWSKRGR